MVDRLKHEGTSHSSSDLLKIFVKMGASWSAQDFRQTGVTQSGSGHFFYFLLPEDLVHLIFSDLNCRCGEEGVAGGVIGCVERCPEQVWGIFLNLQ